MGMGFTFITSPDQLESPPAAARSCVETSLTPQAQDDDSFSAAAILAAGNALLLPFFVMAVS